MVNTGLNFDATYESPDEPIFYSDRDNVRVMWEYINMSFQDMSAEILHAFEDSHVKLQELNRTKKVTSTKKTQSASFLDTKC